ncbi:MAG: hypothetical protein MI919_35465 [Holophagales bacterium]|nr:hypothetical protein [Holophagales bacterium]
MPVRKFRDVSEMPDIWHEPGSPELFRAIREVWNFADETVRPRFPPGVNKHRSIESLYQLEEEWERENVRAYRERQRRVARATESASDSPS